MKKRVLLLGYYGQGNYGDELMLDAILNELSDFDVTVGKTGTQVGVEYKHGLVGDDVVVWAGFGGSYLRFFSFISSLLRSDYVIFGGGTLFFDNVTKGYRNLYGVLRVSLLSVLLRKKYSFYGIGVGELFSDRGKAITKFILKNADFVCFRDNKSLAKAISLIGPKPEMPDFSEGADPVFLREDWKEHNATNDGKGLIVFCGMPIGYRIGYSQKDIGVIERIVSILEKYISHGNRILMIPMQIGQRDDREFNQEVYDACNSKSSIEVVKEKLEVDILTDYLKRADCVVTMRYHSALMGLMFGSDVLAICVTEKLLNWCKTAPDCVQYLDMTNRVDSTHSVIMGSREYDEVDINDRIAYLRKQDAKAKRCMLNLLGHV